MLDPEASPCVEHLTAGLPLVRKTAVAGHAVHACTRLVSSNANQPAQVETGPGSRTARVLLASFLLMALLFPEKRVTVSAPQLASRLSLPFVAPPHG